MIGDLGDFEAEELAWSTTLLKEPYVFPFMKKALKGEKLYTGKYETNAKGDGKVRSLYDDSCYYVRHSDTNRAIHSSRVTFRIVENPDKKLQNAQILKVEYP